MELEIVIRGKAKSGKTRAAIAITKLLKSLGASVTLWDDDRLPPGAWSPPYIQKGLKVSVTTEMVPRGMRQINVNPDDYSPLHEDGFCPCTEDHVHQVDSKDIVGADGDREVVDVICSACHRHGSFMIPTKEINWEAKLP